MYTEFLSAVEVALPHLRPALWCDCRAVGVTLGVDGQEWDADALLARAGSATEAANRVRHDLLPLTNDAN